MSIGRTQPKAGHRRAGQCACPARSLNLIERHDDAGLIAVIAPLPSEARWRPYQITAVGAAALAAQLQRRSRIVEVAKDATGVSMISAYWWHSIPRSGGTATAKSSAPCSKTSGSPRSPWPTLSPTPPGCAGRERLPG